MVVQLKLKLTTQKLLPALHAKLYKPPAVKAKYSADQCPAALTTVLQQSPELQAASITRISYNSDWECLHVQFASKISMISFSESISGRVPFAGSSIHGPFITLRMLQASLYSRSGRSLGVRRKHLQAKERGGYQMSRGLQICMLYKVLSALSLTVAC